MSKDEDLMRPEDKIQQGASKMVLVLAPGAADASEGTVWVAEDTLRSAETDRKLCRRKKQQEVEHKMYAEKQPGEGFWSIAPGCGDISEGMVWVSVIRKKQKDNWPQKGTKSAKKKQKKELAQTHTDSHGQDNKILN